MEKYKSLFDKTWREKFNIVDVSLPYEEKDGKIVFIFKKSINEDLRGDLVKQYSNLIDVLSLKKKKESEGLGHTKGLYKTFFDWIKDEGVEGLETYEKKETPLLINAVEGFYVEDKCISEPKCGYCGNYYIIKRGIDQSFFLTNQIAALKHFTHYFLSNVKEVINKKIEENPELAKKGFSDEIMGPLEKMITPLTSKFWIKVGAEQFRDKIKPFKEIIHNDDQPMSEGAEDRGWTIYKNPLEAVEECFIVEE